MTSIGQVDANERRLDTQSESRHRSIGIKRRHATLTGSGGLLPPMMLAAERGLDGFQMADTFLGALSSSLVGALGDAFTLSAVVVALSFLAALFLKVRVENRRG